MTNLEKYMDEIEAILFTRDEDCELYHLSSDTSTGCPDHRNCEECHRETLEWIAKEAEE